MTRSDSAPLPAPKPHAVRLDDRNTLSVTGVERVDRFHEEELALVTAGGRMVIRGHGLHVEKLSVESGQIAVSGRVDAILYETDPEKGGLLARLFR